MIDGSDKHNRQLAFELQKSHVCEKRSNRVQTESPGSNTKSILANGKFVGHISGRFYYPE